MSKFSADRRQKVISNRNEAQRAKDDSIEQPRNRRERRLVAKKARRRGNQQK